MGGVADHGGYGLIAEDDAFVYYVEGDLGVWIRFYCSGDLSDVFLRCDEAGNAERGAVAEENFGVAFGDDSSEAVAVERLRGVLAGAATTEVDTGEEDARALEFLVV